MNPETPSNPEAASSDILIKKKQGFLKKLGAGSLGISLFFHAVVVVIGIFLVIATIPPEKEKEVDFKPSGGGGGARSSSNQKKSQATMSKQLPNRVAAANVAGTFALPEPTSSSSMSALGALGAGGMGGMGSGGGKGDGKGMGTGNGMGMGIGSDGAPKGLMVFGTALNVRSIGVVMDVSGSMTRHLPKVLEELDRVAKGSPVILHVGCSIEDIRTRPNIDAVDSPMKKGVDHFKFFWCLYQDPQYRNNGVYARDKVDLSLAIPSPDVYEKFAKRSGTYYNDPEGRRSTADAILAKQFEKVDAIYWFADFQDKIDPKAAEEVLRTLKRRKQKLYIHASDQGNYIDAARDLICIPSGGKEIVVDQPKKK